MSAGMPEEVPNPSSSVSRQYVRSTASSTVMSQSLSSVSQSSSSGGIAPVQVAVQSPPTQNCVPGRHSPTRPRSSGEPHSRERPSTQGQPSSAVPSQSLSIVSHAIGGPSAIPGRTVASSSSQSGPQVGPLQQAYDEEPSPSASRKPSVSGLQSSSWPSQ